MKKYYLRTFVGMAVVIAAVVVVAVVANTAAADAAARYERLRMLADSGRSRRAGQQQRAVLLDHAMKPVTAFAAAWRDTATLPERGAAEKIRSDIEAIAQRQLGLVTDNAITPQPERYVFQGIPVRVQRVTLRASGRDLVALLTWLGKVEERYPAALVEHCEFSSNVGGNTGLTLRLVQPVRDAAHAPALAGVALPDPALVPDAIAAVPWQQYVPAKTKAAVGVAVTRNPLQPAISSDVRTAALLRTDADDLTPRLETALDGRLRSVIRGPSPLVVIDGRIFRVGDELVLGNGREKPIADAKTRLKHIGEDRLIFQVSGGSAERPLQCEVAYGLPAFLKAR